jgi:hypothetical protein
MIPTSFDHQGDRTDDLPSGGNEQGRVRVQKTVLHILERSRQ